MINTYVALDLETTGIDPVKSEILEIGAVKVVDGNVVDTYGTLLNIDGDIPKQVVELTGITKSMTTTGIPERQAMDEICDFCKGYVLLGHNIRFDYSFLKAKSMKYKLQIPNDAVDTLKIARKCLPKEMKKSLEVLRQYYGIRQTAVHRAYEDAAATQVLYEILEKAYSEKEPGLFRPGELQCRLKRQTPATARQKNYLKDLTEYHRIVLDVPVERLSRSEASRLTDKIIAQYGKPAVSAVPGKKTIRP